MVDMGKKGRANYKKLTEEQVIAIRNDTTTFQRTLAKQYGVAQPTICRIKSGKLFQRLPKTKNHLQFETK
jgi:predicted transcriptional regulator